MVAWRFIRKFARTTESLQELTKKKVSIPACEDIMQQLKEKLISAPVPSFGKPYMVKTDASIKGLGAILSQMQSDETLYTPAGHCLLQNATTV